MHKITFLLAAMLLITTLETTAQNAKIVKIAKIAQIHMEYCLNAGSQKSICFF